MSGHGENEGSTSVVLRAFIANFAIAVAKFVVAFLSGSASMLSEAVHSLADTGNQVVLLIGIRRARRAEDSRHEFGYGSERYFWAFIVAVSLFTMGAYTSGSDGQCAVPNSDPWRGYLVTALALLVLALALPALTQALPVLAWVWLRRLL